MRPSIELLAPAGGVEALHAAVCAGADAVYLGLGEFNARRGADNFTMESFAEACRYAHLRGVRVYVTLNTIVLPSEVDRALELARQAWRRGADAFIVQDLGVASELARSLPQARLHLSTQMNTHNEAGIHAAACLGAKRVTLSRELALEEIARLAEEARSLGIEVETFAHGALCVCYSGQCLMSSMIGGRSANRGCCAQACRLPYTLYNRAQRKPLDAPGEHLLSPRDLCSVDLLPQLAEAGVSSLKIEGRMKSADYVFAVVGVYRAVLDRTLAALEAADGGGLSEEAQAACRATDEEHRRLDEAFSRGFTTAYLEHERGNGIMSYGRPNNRGVFVGRVASVRAGQAAVASECELAVGDVLEFWTNKGHFAHTLCELRRDADGNVLVRPDNPLGKGDRVFRVRSAADAFVDDAFEPRVGVEGHVVARIGQPLSVEFWPTGASACAEAVAGDEAAEGSGTAADVGAVGRASGPVVEPARTKPLVASDVREHIGRFGQTPFRLEGLEVQLDEGAGMGFSQLHRARAAALDDLAERLAGAGGLRTLPRTTPRTRLAPARPEGVLVAAWATNPACARAARKAGADLIYVPALNIRRGEAVVAGQRSQTVEQAGYPKQAVTALPVVDHDVAPGTREHARGVDVWRYVRQGKPVFVESLGSLVRASEAGALVEVGPHLPLTNRLALQTAALLGARRAWLSPELTLGQIADLAQDAPLELGLFVVGAQELMVTEHCLLMSQGPCNEDCDACPRRKSPHYLRDRRDFEFPVVTDAVGRSHLYNGVQLDIVHAVPDLIAAGVSALMVDTTLMNVEEAAKATARVVRARNVALSSGSALQKTAGTTSGHLYRGVS